MKKFFVSNKKFYHTFERHSRLRFFSDDLRRDWCDLCKNSPSQPILTNKGDHTKQPPIYCLKNYKFLSYFAHLTHHQYRTCALFLYQIEERSVALEDVINFRQWSDGRIIRCSSACDLSSSLIYLYIGILY